MKRRSNPTPHPTPHAGRERGPDPLNVVPTPPSLSRLGAPVSVWKGTHTASQKGPIRRVGRGTHRSRVSGLRKVPPRYHVEAVCRAMGLPQPEREFRFHVKRLWRFDYAWVEWRVALEVEGLVRPGMKSRHTTNAGYKGDMEKYNEAGLGGWLVVRCVPRELYSRGMEFVERALVVRGWGR